MGNQPAALYTVRGDRRQDVESPVGSRNEPRRGRAGLRSSSPRALFVELPARILARRHALTEARDTGKLDTKSRGNRQHAPLVSGTLAMAGRPRGGFG